MDEEEFPAESYLNCTTDHLRASSYGRSGGETLQREFYMKEHTGHSDLLFSYQDNYEIVKMLLFIYSVCCITMYLICKDIHLFVSYLSIFD